MFNIDDAMEMYKSIMACSSAKSLSDVSYMEEIHNEGKLVYRAFGEGIGSYDDIAELNNVEPKALFMPLSYGARCPSAGTDNQYTRSSATKAIARVWLILERSVYAIYLGELVRFMIAEALGEVSNNIELQYNYTRLFPGDSYSILRHGAFSIMANKDTYIQMVSFWGDDGSHVIYSRSKVDGVELFFRDVAPSELSGDGLHSLILKVVDRHFRRFVEGVIELNGG